jgi:protein-tyrosine phosphatase
MARIAALCGTTDLVVTPHANPEYCFSPDRIAQRLAELTDLCDGALRLYTGCDLHLSYENIEDAIANPSKYSINGRNYLLVEFSDLLIFHNTGEIFARFGEVGLTPVVTHPERNALLRRRIDEIAKWVEEGAAVQVTAQSLTGKFGKPAQAFCRDLLDRGLVHFVASDGHDCEYRPPRLDQAYAWLVKNYNERTAEVLCTTNPHATLEGGSLESLSPEAPAPSRKWLPFWR